MNATLFTLQDVVRSLLNDTSVTRVRLNQHINIRRRQLHTEFQSLQEEIESATQNLKAKAEVVTVDELNDLTAKYLDRISKMRLQAHPLQELKSMWDTLMRLVDHAVDVEQEELDGYEKEVNKCHRGIDALMLQVCKEEGVSKPENLHGQKAELRNLIRKYQGMEGFMLQRYKETMIYLFGFGDWDRMDRQYSGQ